MLVGPACAGDAIVVPDGVTSVTAPTTVELELGETRQISADVSVVNGASTNLTWQSSDPTVATVVGQGSGSHLADVTAVSLGSATIRVTSAADTTKFAETTVI